MIVARGERSRRLSFGVASRSLTMFIDTEANVQELSAATKRIAGAAGPFISVFVHTDSKEGKCGEVDVCPDQKVVSGETSVQYSVYVIS